MLHCRWVYRTYCLLIFDVGFMVGWRGVGGGITFKYTLNRYECVLESLDIYTWNMLLHET